MKNKNPQKGQYIGLGIAIGLPLGVPIGLAMGNIAIGLPFGMMLGAILGAAWEKIGNKNPVELTGEQKKQQKIFTWLGVVIGVMLLISIVALFLSRLN